MPLKHIYNHEPIYGNHAKVQYTDEEFEKYFGEDGIKKVEQASLADL